MYKVLTAGLIALSLVSVSAIARAADVSDQGHFFSAGAIEKANQSIRDIEKRSGHEIRIETHATVPSDKIDAVAKMDKKSKEKFMQEWIGERAEATEAKGYFLLISKDPPRMETWVSHHLKKAGFTTTDNDRAKEAMLAGLKDKDFDRALHDVISKLSTAYARTATPHSGSVAPLAERPLGEHPQTAQSQTEHHPIADRPVAQHNRKMTWSPIFYILGAVVLGIFVISMISRMFGGGNSAYGGGYNGAPMGRPGYGGGPMGQPGYGGYGGGYGGNGGGGGGFMRGLAGGVFGAMAGNWLYNSMSGHSAHAQETLPGADPTAGHQVIGNDPSSQDNGGWSSQNDSSGGGGWFGNDSGGGGGDAGGGGDFGGGGGDSGGGDYGGGGDF